MTRVCSNARCCLGSAFAEGQCLAQTEELCPCLATLIEDGKYVLAAITFAEGFGSVKVAQGGALEFACGHCSPLACLAAVHIQSRE